MVRVRQQRRQARLSRWQRIAIDSRSGVGYANHHRAFVAARSKSDQSALCIGWGLGNYRRVDRTAREPWTHGLRGLC